MSRLITGGSELMKLTLNQSKKLTNKMADTTMLNKLVGNPILGVAAKNEERANPLNLFKNDGLPFNSGGE